MIFKRAVARLRAQDWTAIAIELTIVVVGVFIGTWVNDWRQSEEERREIGRLLEQVRVECVALMSTSEAFQEYYATTSRNAHVALAAWNGDPKVSDRNFVIAAYQASQVAGLTGDSQALSTVLGGEQVKKIDDPALRKAVARVLQYDFSQVNPATMHTQYRDDVRETIPLSAQEKIRAACGDFYDKEGVLHLPASCNADLTPVEAREGAAALRDRPELIRELRLHQSAVSTFLFALGRLESELRDVERIDR
ncbi:hypothetical protein ABDK56_12065 [Sphingomonas sp. ASV193]|uniref:hypothetical protein n=1 Tax=Sphingomonas sp. ASV193 TaxID=3144405 RepID=UPI0032E88877